MGEESAEDILYCTECGAVIKPEEKLCPNCGIAWGKPGIEEPDKPVLFKTYTDSETASAVIKNLEANKISVIKGLKPWEDSSSFDLFVRAADLEKAEKVIALLSKNSVKMLLADIFSNTFTVIGKTIKKSLVLCLIFLPAFLLGAFCINSFVSGFYMPKADKNTAYVYAEKADSVDIMKQYPSNGYISEDSNAVLVATGIDTAFVHTGDSATVYLDENNYKSYVGIISSVETLNAVQRINDSTSEKKYNITVSISDKDKNLIPGIHCESNFDGEKRDNVLGVNSNSLYVDEDSLNNSGNSQNYVYILKNGRAKKTIVAAGLSDESYTEIISGVKTGDSVVYSTTQTGRSLEDGVKATANLPGKDMVLADIPGNVTLLICGIVFFIFSLYAINIGVTKAASLQMQSINYRINDILESIFSKTFLRTIGITLLTLFVSFIPAFIVFIIIAVASELNNKVFTALTAVLLIPAFVYGMYIYIKLSFAPVHTIAAGEPIIDSIKKSSELVNKIWWRTFGIIMLTSLVVNFVVSLLSTPVSFIFMWDYISQSMHAGAQKAEQAQSSVKMFKSIGWGLSLSMIFSYILQNIIAPVFSVVMYYDLKIRKKDYFVKLEEEN
jgi:hypothetical protein